MEKHVLWTMDADGTEIAVVDGLSVEECRKIQTALKKLAEYERAEAEERLLLLPVPVGGNVYHRNDDSPYIVIGYRIGRMITEDEDEYEEDYDEPGLYIECEGEYMNMEDAVARFGVNFFRTKEEALAKL